MFCGDLNGKEIQKRGAVCIGIADLLTYPVYIYCKAKIIRSTYTYSSSYSYIRLLFFGFPSHLGHHRTWGRVTQ